MTTIKKQAKSTLVFVIFLIVLCSGSTIEAAEKKWTGAMDTNWSNGDNWDDLVEPNEFSDVIIPDANTTSNDPTIDAICYCKNITIKSGGILNGGSNVLDVSGDWTNDGTFNADTGGITFTGSGDSTIAGTNATTFYNLQVQKTDTHSVYVTTDNCSSSYQTLVDSGTLDFSNADVTFMCDIIEFSPGGLSSQLKMDDGDLLDCSGSFVFNSGATENITGGTIMIASSLEIDSGASFTPTGGVVVFYDGSDAGIDIDSSSAFYDLEINKSPGISATAQTGVAVSNNFTITSGIFDTNGFDMSVAGNWTNNDTLDPDYSKVTFNGTSTINSGGTGAGKAFYNVELNGTSATLSTNDIDIDGDFTITSGTWNTGGFGMYVAGDWTNNDTFDPGSGTVTFDDSGDQTIGNAETFYGLTINKGGGALRITDGTTVMVNGAFAITGSTPTITGTSTGGYGLTLNGDIIVPGANINYANPVTIGGSGSATFNNVSFADFIDFAGSKFLYVTRTSLVETFDGCSFGPGPNGIDRYNVHVNATGTSVYFSNYGSSGGEGEDNDYDQVGNALWMGPGDKFWVGGISTSWSEGGNWSPSGTPISTDNVFIVGGPNNPTLDVTGNCKNITIDGSGTLSGGSNVLNVYGNWTNDGTFIPGSGTVTFNGSGSLISGGTSAGPFYNLTVSSGTRNVTTNSVKVNGQLTINSGAAFQITNGGLNLHTGQTVDLDGTLSLDASSGSGGIYWYVNEGTSVDVDSGATLSLDGFDDSNRVYLRSSADGNQWYLNDHTSSASNPIINYVDVKDSDASLGDTIWANNGTNVDSGNNINWIFNPVIFVDADAPAPGPGDGASWYDAYKYLQDALDEANSIDGPVEIRVAEGTYTPDTNSGQPFGSGLRTESFELIDGVTLKGGYAGFGEPNPDLRRHDAFLTVLSGDLHGNDTQGLDPCDLLSDPNRAENSFHVVTANDVNEVVLDGFTIYGGNANDVSPDCNGGGLFSVDSNITVARCSFFECSASSKGGAMFTIDNRPLEVRVLESNLRTFCPFRGNTAAYGGAIYDWNSSSTITNCTFSYNTADANGGGIYNEDSNSVVTGCTFIGNSAVLGGGAMIVEDSNSVVTGCTFIGNSAVLGGGAMIVEDSNSVVTGCTFIGNSAVLNGGAMIVEDSNSVVTGCSFIGNSATLNGGAMIVEGLGSITKLANCTFSGNDANTGGGIAKIGPSPPTYLTNCILWGNTAYYGSKQAQQIFLGPGTYIDYSCVEGWTGGFGGTGNIGDDPNNDDPDFVREPNDGGDGWGVGDNDDYGDLHLVPGWPGSPCIDTGDPCDANYIGQVDIDGDPRVSDGRVDMGSDEVIWDGATGISPDANVILNPGGGPNDLNTEALVLFDNNSAGDANIIVVEMSSPVYPSEGYFQVLGTTLRIDTTLSDGEFSAIVVIPFDGNDLAGADPCKLNLMYYDAVSEAWKLAVAGNTGADPIGTRWLELAPSDPPPTWETLESRALGDYGTYWEPSTSKGLVSAIVDHFTNFSAAGHGIPDFEPDGDVDFVDFAFFAEWWQESGCGICGGVELTGDGSVGFDDLRELADNWLEGK